MKLLHYLKCSCFILSEALVNFCMAEPAFSIFISHSFILIFFHSKIVPHCFGKQCKAQCFREQQASSFCWVGLEKRDAWVNGGKSEAGFVRKGLAWRCSDCWLCMLVSRGISIQLLSSFFLYTWLPVGIEDVFCWVSVRRSRGHCCKHCGEYREVGFNLLKSRDCRISQCF